VRTVVCLYLAACQSAAHPPAAPARQSIEVRDGAIVTARVTAGHPCRAVVDGTELLVGGRPLVAQIGGTRWSGEDRENGTTLSKNDAPIARIHANQLFDGEGIPVLRVSANGDIANAAGQVTRRAVAVGGPAPLVRIGDLLITGLRGTASDIPLAAMLTAPGVSAELRGLAACHYLLSEPSESPSAQPASP
jgi:hypothetical protein